MKRVTARISCGLLAVAIGACGGGGGTGGSPAPAGAMCAPTDAVLPGDATLAGMEGTYRVVAVAPDGRRVEGRVEFTERPVDMRSVGRTSLPLEGTAEIDFAAIGAVAPSGMDSADSQRPGVLVLESDEASGRRILVRFGAAANDLAQPMFDGSITRFEPREIRTDGFLGTWRSGGGRSSSGYFCAWPDGT